VIATRWWIGTKTTAGAVALLLGVACDDERTVTAVQSPRDTGTPLDLGPPPDAETPVGGEAGGGTASPPDAGPSPDADRCEPPAPGVPAPPEGRCAALAAPGGEDPFADVPCAAPVPFAGLSEPAQVVYTALGVPHVYAASVEDALRLQGYLVARDRYFQMELTRRNTLGLLGGWLSGLALATDISNRTAGQALAARRTYESGTSPTMRAWFEAYAEGVNAYIDRVVSGAEPRPPEFLILGDIITLQTTEELMPRWTGLDVAAGAAAISYALAFDGEDLGRSLALTRADTFGDGLPDAALRREAAKADLLGDLRPVVAVAQTGGGAAKPDASPRSAEATTDGLAVPPGLERMAARLDARFRARRGPGDRGSNTWAVDAAHGNGGAAYLASDPHLDLGAPTFFYQMHLDTTLLNPDETDRLQAAGVTLPGTPFVVIGHTDRLAWGITNLNADDTDFYLERVVVQNGRPATTIAPGGAVALVRAVDERYDVARAPLAGIPSAFQCTIPRYETADGRMLVALEGTPVDDVDCTAPPAGAVNIDGEWLVPGDVDQDGVISGISFDFTGLDANPLAHTIEGYLRARNIDDFMEAQRHSGVFNNAQAVADVNGDVATTGFHAVPRRAYLRAEDGRFAEGGDPSYLLDATRFPGFEVTLDAELRVVTDDPDPRRQMVPFDAWPRSVRPTRGFVVSANNELAGGTFDGDLGNDDPYIGWNFDIGFRADRITRLLASAVEAPAGVDFAAMAAIQNDHRSNFAALLLPRLSNDVSGLECGHPQATDALARLRSWADRGLRAAAGVETFYHPALDPTEVDDAVATTIFNGWMAFLLRAVLDDERLDGVHWNGGGTDGRARLLARLVLAPEAMAGFEAARADHVYWDDTNTPAVETRGEVLCAALGRSLDHLAGSENGGFGTSDPDAWRWGLRHTVRFAHPFDPILGDDPSLGPAARAFSISPETLPPVACVERDDPRLSLPGFPRPGDNFGVDASTSGWNPADRSYDSGPVQRLVVRIEGGQIRAEVILPGGQSANPESPHWDDQARLWLGNERRPIHFTVEDVAAHARFRTVFEPAP
jgi:penicillin amidase